MAALGISILSPVDLLPGGEIDVRRVRLLGIHNGETLSEFPGLGELTSARVLGRLLYAVAGASFKPSSRTLETSENTELLRRTASRRSWQKSYRAKFGELRQDDVRLVPGLMAKISQVVALLRVATP